MILVLEELAVVYLGEHVCDIIMIMVW